MKLSSAAIAMSMNSLGLPLPEREVRFTGSRRWRFDYAWPAYKVALEVQGGIWIQGRHSRGRGQLNDMAKSNAAQCLGWIVLACEPRDLLASSTVQMVNAAIELQKARALTK